MQFFMVFFSFIFNIFTYLNIFIFKITASYFNLLTSTFSKKVNDINTDLSFFKRLYHVISLHSLWYKCLNL